LPRGRVAKPSRALEQRGHKMTPTDFLDNVVTRNVVHLGEARGSMRRAVNALLTLDAFAGILFAHLESLGRSRWADDSKFREFLAEECPE
jgi:hypothetical protein